MTSYLTNCCCSGHRPKRHMNATIHSRPDIISKLMRERQVSRFLVAPSGYGKTYIALEYAQMLFDFQNTCWLECRSPCFLRDLDAQNLAEQLMNRDAHLQLVIFDDVPRLGAVRSDALSETIDILLENSIEVIVTCKPAADSFSGRQIDRICLNSHELLLTDAEIEQYKDTFSNVEQTYLQQSCFSQYESSISETNFNNKSQHFHRSYQASTAQAQNAQTLWSWRIPVLAWAGSDAYVQFGLGFSREDVPDVVAATMFLMLTLGSGNLPALCKRCGLPTPDVDVLSHNFPHLGISKTDGNFQALNMSIHHIVDGFGALSDKIIAAFNFTCTDEVSWMLTEILLEMGKTSRACELAYSYATKIFRVEWLGKHDRRLFQDRCVLPAYMVAESSKPLRGCDVYRMDVMLAWHFMALGDARDAAKIAISVARADSAPVHSRGWALVLLALYVSNPDIKEAVYLRIQALISACEERGEKCWDSDWYVIAKCILTSRQAGSISDESLQQLVDDVQDSAEFCDITFLALSHIMLKYQEDTQLTSTRNLWEAINKFKWDTDKPFSLFYLIAYQHIYDAYNKHNVSVTSGGASKDEQELTTRLEKLLTSDVLAHITRAQQDIEMQQQRYRIYKNTTQVKSEMANAPKKILTSVQVDDLSKYPILYVNVFGGFELLRDGVPLTSKYFGQAKVRSMLTILVLNDGRECSRERLIEALWPLVNEKSGSKNLYSCWSSLKRSLSLPDGSCPYIERSQGSYKINKQLVKSDVSLVNKLCKKLNIEQTDPKKYCECLDELNTLYKGDLLPSENKNEFILEERRQLRFQVSDIFANAAVRLIEMNEEKMALWFARVAYSHDKLREDVYYSLMSAQLACGQREAAYETYTLCSNMLAKRFQMNPSYRVMSLYKSIVECEEVF